MSDIVISVPHSGTRTLQQYVRERDSGGMPGEDIKHRHFSIHPYVIAEFFTNPDNRAYIPVRNPYDMADSWERRYGDDRHHQGDEMCRSIAEMVEYCQSHAEMVELFKIEDLPVLRGHGPMPEGWQKIDPEHPRVIALRELFRANNGVESFYREMYTDAELSWI